VYKIPLNPSPIKIEQFLVNLTDVIMMRMMTATTLMMRFKAESNVTSKLSTMAKQTRLLSHPWDSSND